MEPRWQPSRNARLTLKQLGMSPAQVESALDAFRAKASEQTDLAFMRFARDHTCDDAVAQRTAEILDLPLTWQPPVSTLNQLQSAGYQPEAIAHYRELFVLSVREQGRALRDPCKAFIAFCRRRATRLSAPMPVDWLPGKEILQQLVHEQGLDSARIPELIDRFIRAQHGRWSPDWDHTFALWSKQQGAEGRKEGRAAC